MYTVAFRKGNIDFFIDRTLLAMQTIEWQRYDLYTSAPAQSKYS